MKKDLLPIIKGESEQLDMATFKASLIGLLDDTLQDPGTPTEHQALIARLRSRISIELRELE